MADYFQRECLGCGMLQEVPRVSFKERDLEYLCCKCDSSLFEQSDGSTLTRDIAHQHETVMQAMLKLDQTLDEAWQGYYQSLRLIVGGGRIREEVLGQLAYYQQEGNLYAFSDEAPNRGAVLIHLRH